MNKVLFVAVAILVCAVAFAGDQFAYIPQPPQRAEVNVDMGNPPNPTAYGGQAAAAPSSARASTGAATATTAPSTATATPQAGAGQAQYNYPGQPAVVYVPMPQSQPAAPPVQNDKGTDPLAILGAIVGIAAVVTIAVALLVQNSQRNQNAPNNTAAALGVSTAQLGMVEGLATTLVVGSDGTVLHTTGTRPAGTATMPSQGNGGGGPVITAQHRNLATTALINSAPAPAAGAPPNPAPTQAQIDYIAMLIASDPTQPVDQARADAIATAARANNSI